MNSAVNLTQPIKRMKTGELKLTKEVTRWLPTIVSCGLFTLCLCLMAVLGYCWWRSGNIVMSKSFGGYPILVREVPHVSEGAVMSSPPGVAASDYIIEVGGNPPETTFRLYQGSERYKPTAITRVGAADEDTFQVQFSNGRQVNIRIAHEKAMLAEWFSSEGEMRTKAK
jgi:hypothetical protein